ncbi:bifunctional nuclease family protein [Aureispira anguillae]|uniref:Bifunctional nuclease family protein n=1 Tax=Aureispira anguillae TaxID=2864201 RepID=A0A915VKF2_9BACT|nr:bifunctional nuclease family protein [Aureispira anguillae]BDS09658.1 bifunctional nuclease family protein [Aureispira anguillae]
MKKIELEIVALSHSLAQTQNYAIVLGEQEGARRLPIVIGEFEAQAIAVAMEGMAPSRPMTHDLFKNALTGFNIEIKEVVINNLVDGIFYANLICILDGKQTEVDSRTSDALALAVRFGCPIYTFEFILEQAGIILEEETEKEVQRAKNRRTDRQPKTKTLDEQSVDELSKLLQNALESEDYEKAAKIRDELNKRNNS